MNFIQFNHGVPGVIFFMYILLACGFIKIYIFLSYLEIFVTIILSNNSLPQSLWFLFKCSDYVISSHRLLRLYFFHDRIPALYFLLFVLQLGQFYCYTVSNLLISPISEFLLWILHIPALEFSLDLFHTFHESPLPCISSLLHFPLNF